MRDRLRWLYHRLRWAGCQLLTLGQAGKVELIEPSQLIYGQLPTSQFPRRARRFVEAGDWDTEVIAIEDHSVYQSMVAHFVDGRPWEETIHFEEAMAGVAAGNGFRGGQSKEEVLGFFNEWDDLYQSIEKSGYLSMGELWERKQIDNPCKRLDEITVNLDRDGRPILNDGWHRFCIVRILSIAPLPVRILARHRLYEQWTPSGVVG